MMEVFAGFLEHTDHHIGRLLEFLEDIGELDNTLIMVISRQRRERRGRPDGLGQREAVLQQRPRNRSRRTCARIDELGGPKHFNHYPWGWTWAGNTPFRRWKRETYRGGVERSVHRLLAEGDQARARCARSTRTRSTWCRPCSTRSGSSRRPRSAASRSRRWRVSASRTPSTTPSARRATTPSTSR